MWPPAQAEIERANRAEVSASRRIIVIIIIVLGLYISLYDGKTSLNGNGKVYFVL